MLRFSTQITSRSLLYCRTIRLISTSKTTFASKVDNHQYANTMNLPKTEFPLRSKPQDVQKTISLASYIYQTQLNDKTRKDEFLLHDGPPYANGSLHIGHAMNKVLKDVVNRYKILKGFRVNYIPGWDCHGLPIELKALEKKSRGDLKTTEIRTLARSFAESTIVEQKRSFQNWGILGDWENPYITMDPKYEAAQLRVFLTMFEKGFIYRGLKPVYWSPSSRTALAEAELEYEENHVSDSVYVCFGVDKLGENAKMSKLASYSNLKAVIWTTTPWTLPANKALCVNPTVKYCVVKGAQDNEHFIIAEERLPSLRKLFGMELLIQETFEGTTLIGSNFHHPFVSSLSVPVLGGDHVTTESGTGVVHTAPGHGFDDFIVCKQHGIPPYAPVDDRGHYTEEAGAKFVGKEIFSEGNASVIEELKSQKALLKHEKFTHKYPYDWRTKKPIIIRATKQWFASLKGSIQDQALKAIENVEMIPNSTRPRMSSMVMGREDWCISRQRVWGVPIPVFYEKETNEPLITRESVTFIENLFAKHGSDCWFSMEVNELLAPEYRNNGKTYVKGFDTMDVWFDSGVSWYAVLQSKGMEVPCDLYLEGSDQHRGWFQSALLTSIAFQNKAPYKRLMTHGFSLDEKGRKMSKSLGNVIDPEVVIRGGKIGKDQTINAFGLDTLRSWVIQSDYSKDVEIGPTVLARVAENLQKVRNTLRFCLANLVDYEKEHAVPISELMPIDRFMLHKLHETLLKVTEGYETFSFYKSWRAITEFVTRDLSTFYFEVCKDRLYADAKRSQTRRSTQTVLSIIFDTLTLALAPVAIHTSEELYSYYPLAKQSNHRSIFERRWINAPSDWRVSNEIENAWLFLQEIRTSVNAEVEKMRQNKTGNISRGIDVSVILQLNKEAHNTLKPILEKENLSDLFVVSGSEIQVLNDDQFPTNMNTNENTNTRKMNLVISEAKKFKCPRCWKLICENEGNLCGRCADVVKSH